MYRGARVDIADGEHKVVVVQLRDGHLAGRHPAEQAVFDHHFAAYRTLALPSLPPSSRADDRLRLDLDEHAGLDQA